MAFISAFIVLYFCSVAANSSGAPTGSGPGCNKSYHLSSSGFPCDHTSVTVFGNTYKTPSGAGNYNIIVPAGSSFAALNVDFNDIDYTVTENPLGGYNYVIWPDNDSTYTVTASGLPFQTYLPTDVTASLVRSFGISGSVAGVPVGRYPASITVTDNGSSSLAGVTDLPRRFDFDLWVIDLAEQDGMLNVEEGKVYEIDLTAVPGDLPHEDVCDISVSWGSLLPTPGVPSVSNLYYDPAQQLPVVEDIGAVCVKKWTYGDTNTPRKVYYYRPYGATGADTIYVRLSINNSVLIEKQLIFNTLTCARLKKVDGHIDGDLPMLNNYIKGYWTHCGYAEAYPSPEWEDVDDDGRNSDDVGLSVFDNNRPFVFSQGDYFHVNSATFKSLIGGNLLSYSYGVKSDKYGYLGTGNFGAVNNDGESAVNVGSDVNEGACLNKIDSQTVTLDWSIGNETVRSRHKVYTIGGSLGFRNDYHTLIEIGCEAAKGLDSSTQQDEVFNRICNKFATLDIKRIDSDDPITYWGNNASLTNSIDDMLYWLTGRCGPWSKFFVKTCELQGISV